MAEALYASLESAEYKCSWCKNFLSESPILMVEGEGLFCGRCKGMIYQRNSNPNIERQLAYEKLAENCEFPCRYKEYGCGKLLKWANVREHQKNCELKKMSCIFNLEEFEDESGCDWKGDRQGFFEHVDMHHACKNPTFQLEIWTNPKSQIFKIMCRQDVFLLILSFIDNIYYLRLIGDNEKQPTEYKIEILDDTKKKSFIYPRFSEYLPYNASQMKKIGMKLEFNDIIPKYLTVSFGDISRCSMVEGKNETLPVCQICSAHMTYLVYTCESSHKICEDCFIENENCVIKVDDEKKCNKIYRRYYDFEDMGMQFECPHRGCFFRGNILEVDSHYSICKCYFLDSDVFHFDTFYELATGHRVFLFDNTVFGLEVTRGEKDLKFELFAYKFMEIKYKFEITIKNGSSIVEVFAIDLTFRDFRTKYYRYADIQEKFLITVVDKDKTGILTYKLNVSKY